MYEVEGGSEKVTPSAMAEADRLYQYESMAQQGQTHSIGSSGSSTAAPNRGRVRVHMQPSTVKCLRRTLNRPIHDDVNAYSLLLWSILKLCKRQHVQAAFCRQFETESSAIQDLLDWAAANLQASFDGEQPATDDQHAAEIVAHLESHAKFLAARAGNATVLHGKVSGPAADAVQQPSTATDLAKTAVAVIDGFYLVYCPAPLEAAPEPAVRRKLAFNASLGTLLAPRQGMQAIESPPHSNDDQQIVSWRLDGDADTMPKSAASDAGLGSRHSQKASQASAGSPRRMSQVTVDSVQNESDASLASVRKGSVASLAGLIEHDEAGSVCSDQRVGAPAVGRLTAYLAGQQQPRMAATQRSPTLTDAVEAHLEAGAPAAKLQSRVLSALKSLVLPSCMRPSPSHSGGLPPAQRQARTSASAVTLLAEAGIQRSRSFEAWILLQEPVTPPPSLHALQKSYSSGSSSGSAAARTALWVQFCAAQPVAAGPLDGAAAAAEVQATVEPVQLLPMGAHAGGLPCLVEVAPPPASTLDATSEQAGSEPSWRSQQRRLNPLSIPGTQAPSIDAASLTATAAPCCDSPTAPSASPSNACSPSPSSSSNPRQQQLSPSSGGSPPPLMRPTSLDDLGPAPAAFESPSVPFNIAPHEIMDPATPSAGSLPRIRTISPSMAYLRRSVGSWASDSPTQTTPQSALDMQLVAPDCPPSPFSAGARAASWASEPRSQPNSHHSRSSTPTHRPPSPIPLPLLPLADEPSLPLTPPGPSLLASGHMATLRRDSWSSDYSTPSPSAARAAETAFANYAPSSLQPQLPNSQLPPPSGLASMRSLPQVPSRLGARRNHLSRAASMRSGVLLAVPAPSPEPDVVDDTGDAAPASPDAAGEGGGEALLPGGRSRGSNDSEIDTHFFSDRGTTITMSGDLGDMGAVLSLAPSTAAAESTGVLHSAFSAPDAMFHYAAQEVIDAEQQQQAAADAFYVEQAGIQAGTPAGLQGEPAPAAVLEAPGPSSSERSEGGGWGGLLGLSGGLRGVAVAGGGPAQSEAEVEEEEEDDAPLTLGHFGSFTGAAEPAHLAGSRLPAALAAARAGAGQAGLAP